MRSNAFEVHETHHQIMPSAREPFVYLEHERLRLEGGRLVRHRKVDDRVDTTTLPYLNVACVLLGPGCSVSSDAMELLGSAAVVVGFVGGNGSPLNMATEPVFASTANEYRPTEYMQQWGRMWFDDEWRLQVARALLAQRAQAIEHFWTRAQPLRGLGVNPDEFFAAAGGRRCDGAVTYADMKFRGRTTDELLGYEGAHVKALCHYLRTKTGSDLETLDRSAVEGTSKRIREGNYIAYGLAATALSALGISYAYPLLHGKTRRGALVFDIADILKDAVTTPLACSPDYADDRDSFRRDCKELITSSGALSYLIDVIKNLAATPKATK